MRVFTPGPLLLRHLFEGLNLIADLAAFSLYEMTAVDFVGKNAFNSNRRPGSRQRGFKAAFIPFSALTFVFSGRRNVLI